MSRLFFTCRRLLVASTRLSHSVPPPLKKEFLGSICTSDWPSQITDFLRRERLSEPTPIQEKTLPISMRQRDVVGVARTGSGKTLAFVIPSILHVVRHRATQNITSRFQKRDPCVLILSPTRELASQTAKVISKFEDTNSLVLVGGASRENQIRQLALSNHDIYIATPGRLLDLLEEQFVNLNQITYLVLDEADRMLDMGFEPQIRKIVKYLPENRQTLMWSATWPEEIRALAEDFMREYDLVAVEGTELTANPNIEQKVEVCEPRDKLERLLYHLNRIFNENKNAKVLIFVATKLKADQMMIQLMRNRINAVVMHGGKTQNARDRALVMFRQNQCRCLIATDVAARGLDIDDITHVINVDFPQTVEDYIHRIGRTARHHNRGESITFFTSNPNDMAFVDKFITILNKSNQKIPDELLNLSEQKHLYNSVKGKSRRRWSSESDGGGGRRTFDFYRR
ncbi:putative ATP-dependent RNA helicase DDX17, partial [Fragariocoptes setiger]